MRLALLSDGYIADVDQIREARFKPCDGDDSAELTIYFADDEHTFLEDDEAITAWHRLRDLCRREGGRE